MVQTHLTFNVIIYAIVIAYILYINIAAYTNKTTTFLNFLIKLFQNWIFRVIFLLVIGYFALDLLPYGGFVLAVLLTIAFLNTNMLMYKRNVGETYSNFIEGLDTDEEDYDDNDLMDDGDDNLDDIDDDVSESFGNYDEYAEVANDAYDGVENYENIENLEDQGSDYDEALLDVYNAVENKERFANKKDSKKDNCGPYAPLMRLPFNPQGYRPDETVLSSGAPDVLPKNSLRNGEYTDSGVAYEFNMA